MIVGPVGRTEGEVFGPFPLAAFLSTLVAPYKAVFIHEMPSEIRISYCSVMGEVMELTQNTDSPQPS